MTSVALCVVTRDRPNGLMRLLDAIERLDVPIGLSLRIVVVDNGDGTARTSVAARPSSARPTTVEWEPDHGIPYARNRALALAAEPDLVAFMDDDEEPCRNWLTATFGTLQSCGADVVVGPSVPSFPESAPRWVVEGGFFQRRRFRTGEPITAGYARTSGVLIRRTSLPPAPVFDTTFRLAGGSDSHLFHRMERSGNRIIWCDDAVMVEHVPATRCNAWWLVRRHYRIGNTRSTLLLRLDHPRATRRAVRIGRGLIDTAAGLVRYVIQVPRGRAQRVRELQRIACGIGLVTGALGLHYQEYRIVHGS